MDLTGLSVPGQMIQHAVEVPQLKDADGNLYSTIKPSEVPGNTTYTEVVREVRRSYLDNVVEYIYKIIYT